MKYLTTVTIGIPAYNESHNIHKLLSSLLDQNRNSWKLDKILVYSDASSDNTENIVSKFSKKNTTIKLLRGKKRVGVAMVENKIIKNSSSDVLILINADVLPVDRYLVDNIVAAFEISPNVCLVGVKVVPVKSNNIFESTINHSHATKQLLFELIKESNPIYLCHGRCRAMKKIFYKKIIFPSVIADDAYNYLSCKNLGYSFAYCSNSEVMFRSPANFSDHVKQSHRYYFGKMELASKFKEINVPNEFKIPIAPALKILTLSVIRNPILSVLYGLILLSTKITLIFINKETKQIAWSPSSSSKKI